MNFFLIVCLFVFSFVFLCVCLFCLVLFCLFVFKGVGMGLGVGLGFSQSITATHARDFTGHSSWTSLQIAKELCPIITLTKAYMSCYWTKPLPKSLSVRKDFLPWVQFVGTVFVWSLQTRNDDVAITSTRRHLRQMTYYGSMTTLLFRQVFCGTGQCYFGVHSNDDSLDRNCTWGAESLNGHSNTLSSSGVYVQDFGHGKFRSKLSYINI